MLNKKIASEIALGVIVLLAVVVGGIFWMQDKTASNSQQAKDSNKEEVQKPIQKEGAMCTQDAKLCDDGSYVSRTGPKCEFAQCPVVDETADWQTYKNEKYGFEFKYPINFGEAIFSEHSIDSDRGVYSGRSIGVKFSGKDNISFSAYTDDFSSFSPFELSLLSYDCLKPLVYRIGQDVCKIITVDDENAVFRNILLEIEGGLYPKTAVLIKNKSMSEFTKLAFSVSFLDLNDKTGSMYSAVDEKGRNDAITFGLDYYKKIMEGGKILPSDEIDLDIFNNIIATFKFTK